MTHDYEIKFWKDWLEGDILKRKDLVKKLPIVKRVWNMKKLPKKVREHFFTSTLNDFFEDLESAVYTKIRIDKENKKRSKIKKQK